jgi:molecular chaperone GrpE
MEEKEVKNTTPEEQNAENLSNVDDTAEINETVEGTEISQQLYEMSKIKEELQEQKDKYLRLYAEFDNFRRRSAKERIEYTQTAGQEVIKSLLEVLDDCSRAEKQMYKTEDPTIIREGLQLVFHKCLFWVLFWELFGLFSECHKVALLAPLSVCVRTDDDVSLFCQ